MQQKNIILTLSMIFVLFSCGDNGGNDPEPPVDNFDRKALLVDLADGIIIPAFEDYVSKTQSLNSAAHTFVVDPSMAKLTSLRSQWLDAYTSWQYVSMFNIGKAEEISLRNFTNIYPADVTEIDENISSGTYNLELPSKNDEQGFPALDYMLFGIGDSDEDVVLKYNEEAYQNYLTDLTDKMEEMGNSVLTDWQNGYRETFIENDGSSATSSLNKLVNDYLFYYEKFLRAGKIGIPAGVFSGSELPEKVEGLYSKTYSKDLFLTGLDASNRFFNGIKYDTDAAGTGLNDYLDYLNTIKEGADLSQLINNQFDAARISAQDLNENFAQQIEEDNLKMLETYDELQKNVILLKVDMLQALNIKVDFVDADGD